MDLSSLFQLNNLLMIMFLLIIIFGQRIQVAASLAKANRLLKEIDKARGNTRREILAELRSSGGANPEQIIDRMLGYFAISPVDLDPAGIVKKIDYLYSLQRERIREELHSFLPGVEKTRLMNIEGLLGVAVTINLLFGTVRHLYLSSKEVGSIFYIAQLETLLPIVREHFEALLRFVVAVRIGHPIGDSIGPLVVSKFMKERGIITKDTVYSQMEFEGRKLILVKAEGPGSNIGRIGEAVEILTDRIPAKAIITIDASAKLKGEESGEVLEGVGAAIGIRTDRYKIEEIATAKRIPLYAIVVKQSIEESLSEMSGVIKESVSRVNLALYRLIREKAKQGDSVIIAGVGNTMGVE